MSTADIDTVCTEQQLADVVLGSEHLANLRPEGWATFEPVRQSVLDEVLRSLKGRTPSIAEADLDDVSELRTAVIYGSLARIYRAGMTSADPEDRRAAHAKTYQRMYEAEVRALQPSVVNGQRGGPGSISVHRG